jgi:hypothetical protein
MLSHASVRIVRDVREWLSGRADHHAPPSDWLAGDDAVCCLEVLLEARENWLSSPDPTLWRTGDAHCLLSDTDAPSLTDVYRLTEQGPTGLRVRSSGTGDDARPAAHQAMPTQLARQHSNQRGQYCMVSPGRTRPADLTPQHSHLVSQHQNFHVLGRRTTDQQTQPLEHPQRDQIY